jgi:hypothetical protein
MRQSIDRGLSSFDDRNSVHSTRETMSNSPRVPSGIALTVGLTLRLKSFSGLLVLCVLIGLVSTILVLRRGGTLRLARSCSTSFQASLESHPSSQVVGCLALSETGGRRTIPAISDLIKPN